MKYIAYLISVICTLTVFSGCNNSRGIVPSEVDKEAEAFKDSVKDADALCAKLAEYKSKGEVRAEIIIREALGKIYRDRSNFEKAITQHDSAIILSRQIGDTLNLVWSLNQQATNLRRMGDLDEASKFHFEALGLCDAQKGDTSFVARKNRVVSLNGLGNVLMSLGNYDEAGKMFEEALKGEASLGSALGQAINYANIGSIYEKQGKHADARTYYNKSMKMNREADNVVGIGLCYQYLGHLDEKLGNRNGALTNFLKSYNTLLATNDAWHWLEPCNAMARMYLSEANVDSASKYVGLSVRTANAIHSVEHQAEGYELYAEYEEKWGSPARALQFLRYSQSLNDSLNNEKNLNQIQNQRVNYEAKRRSSELNEAREETKNQQYVSIAVGVISLILVAALVTIIVSLYSVSKMRKKTLQQRQEFYRDITHRFRTPLTVVIGMTQELHTHINPEDKVAKEEFAAVERQNALLLQLINEMMSKLKPESKDKNSVAEVQIGTKAEIAQPIEIEGVKKDNNAIIVQNVEKSIEEAVSEPEGTETTAEPETKNTKETATESAKSKPLILLAEDNPDVASYQKVLLQKDGFDVIWAQDGVEALELLENNMPQLVITDVMMPRMDGLELCRRIRGDQRTSHLPLIIVTARVEDRDRLAGMEAGAEVYMTKPFLGEELLMNIHRLIEQRELLRRKFLENKDMGESAATSIAAQNIEYTQPQRDFTKMVNEAIDARLGDTELNSTVLAASMCLSRTQLNRRLKALLDVDTTHYIRERRLQHAQKMLTKTDKSVMDIQVACGFDTPGYFSRTFKARFELSPLQYRKKYKKK